MGTGGVCMKGYKTVGLPRQPSLTVWEKRRRKPWKNKPATENFPPHKGHIGAAGQKGKGNGKNGTYD